MRTAGKKLLSLALAALLALGTLPQTVLAVGATPQEGTGGKIIAFEALSDSVAHQTKPLGTSLEDLDLPETLTATVEAPAAAEPEDGERDSGEPAQEGTPSDAQQDGSEGGQPRMQVVTGPAFALGNTDRDGSPDLPAEDNTGSTQTGSVPVTEWTAEPEYDPDTPDTYIFTPVLDEAYSLAADVELPVITVEVIAAAAPFALRSAIQSGTPNFVWDGSNISVVGFGGKEWYVIGYNGNGVYSTEGEAAVTLLAKNYDFGTTLFHNSSNYYSGSTLKTKMEEAHDALPEGEKELVNARALEGGSGNYNADGYDPDKIAGSAVEDAHFWPLSVSEADSLTSTVQAFGYDWWLRSPGYYDHYAAVVYYFGTVSANGYDVGNIYAVRPAFQLDLESVLFASAAAGGKSALGEGLVEAEPPDGAVKFTMVDDTDNLNLTIANTTDPITAEQGETVEIAYNDAVTGTNKYVSAVIADGDEVLYYGKLSQAASGTASFTVPSDLVEGGTYTLKLFNEECNGDNETDFASTPVEIQLTVEESGGGNDNFAVGTWTGENGHRWVELGGILWRILEVTASDTDNPGKKTALLLAEEAVATRQFHTRYNSGDNDWNSSDLKAWLNNKLCEKNGNDYTENGFMNRFSADEKAAIVTANYTYGGSYAGNGTTGSSKVFLLSTDDAYHPAYFADDVDRQIGSNWWLRSPGNFDDIAAVVNYNGYVHAAGSIVLSNFAVRPALKINLASSIFTSKNPLVQAEVTVESGGTPVEDANISFSGASAPDAVVSEADGTATVRLELGESYTMTVSKSGYESYTHTIEITQANQAISVILTPSDTTPPTVESITPANNATDVERSGNIVITFDEPMKTTAGTVSLNGAGALTGGTWSNGNKTFTVPYFGLGYSTQYTVNISGFQDVAGNAMTANNSNRFTTVAAPLPATYAVNVNGSYASTTGAGNYAENDTVTIHAGTRSNYRFTGWMASGVTLASPGSPSTTFTMPANPVTVTANWAHTSSSSGSDDSDSGSKPIVTITPAKQPDWPTIGSVSGKVTGTTAQRTFTITDSLVKAAIEKAQAEAKKQGRTAYGIGVQLALDTPSEAGLTLALKRAAINRLVSEKAKQLELTGTPIALTLDAKALAEIQKQSTGDVTITVKPTTVKDVRNAYDISFSYVKNGKAVSITSLGAGSATLSIPFTPGKNEAAGRFYAVSVDANGKVSRIADSAYDANSGSVMFRTNHFSVYGVGYTAPSAKFTDTAKHWAVESIDYVVGRGLLTGTTETTFAPDTAMTRAMLVTALGRLAGVDVKAYTTNSFTDVKADSVFRPYIEWARSKGIVQGIGGSQFAPDRAVTREEIAAIFANYAKATGYTLPVTREATTYADASGIGSAYKTAVTAMQQAGLMMGGTNNKFNPKSNATRAEVSAMLHRYIKLTIAPDTAQGWAKNDAGQFLYYKDGKALAGTQTIDGTKYFFNTDGTLKTGWVQDGGNWKFYSGNKLLTGWWDIGANGNNKRYYFDTYGNMISGKWLQIEGKWYYFYADGSLAKSTKIDEYEVDENGVRKTK